ncbi:class I SAM-dependent methyltransferase [Crocosphaera sp.]|uniref:class I SAM-dependent methyltransferase n=1 Tax=Crocosphaera sp. TaxID=2729996 RepID=UPI003F23760C|nr:methyltransferase domain-containing protein [Crocosphaera sp.]
MSTLIQLTLRYLPRTLLQPFAGIASRFFRIVYKGDNYQCPICQMKFRKLLPHGRLQPRENALCPNCLSLERHRLLWLFLKNKTNFFEQSLKVLHFAPEICLINRFNKQKNLEYCTADLESPWAMDKFDIQEIPYNQNTFDVVLCNHVMEHIDDDLKAMKEIYRILKPGGWAIIQSPQDLSLEVTYEDTSITTPFEREKAFGQSDHLRLYGLDYGQRLKQAGFQVTEDDFVKKLDDELIKFFCVPEDEIIYYCQKI